MRNLYFSMQSLVTVANFHLLDKLWDSLGLYFLSPPLFSTIQMCQVKVQYFRESVIGIEMPLIANYKVSDRPIDGSKQRYGM